MVDLNKPNEEKNNKISLRKEDQPKNDKTGLQKGSQPQNNTKEINERAVGSNVPVAGTSSNAWQNDNGRSKSKKKSIPWFYIGIPAAALLACFVFWTSFINNISGDNDVSSTEADRSVAVGSNEVEYVTNEGNNLGYREAEEETAEESTSDVWTKGVDSQQSVESGIVSEGSQSAVTTEPGIGANVSEPDEPDTVVPETAEPLTFESLEDSLGSLDKANITFVSCDVSDYPVVKLYYTVEDDYGNTIKLEDPIVMLREKVNGKHVEDREVGSFEQLEGKEGISIDIVADKSGSMDYYLHIMKDIMSEFVNGLDYASGDQAELIAFDSYVMYMCTYTDKLSLLQNGIMNMEADGSTALYDALYGAIMNAGGREGARCVIAFTDGDDNVSTHTWEDVEKLACLKEVPVFIIGFGDLYYQDELITLTANTGGAYQSIDQLQDMSDILKQIYKTNKQMYCLEYVSDADADAYDERDIELVLADDAYGSRADSSVVPVKIKKHKHTSRYEVIAADVSWEEANAECMKRGGHLITITSAKEEKKAQSLAEKKGLKYVWIGGYTSRNDADEIFGHWVTGEDFSYEKWYPGEPSGYDLDGVREMYLMLWMVSDEWSWNDQRSDPIRDTGLKYFLGKTGYICEYEE